MRCLIRNAESNADRNPGVDAPGFRIPLQNSKIKKGNMNIATLLIALLIIAGLFFALVPLLIMLLAPHKSKQERVPIDRQTTWYPVPHNQELPNDEQDTKHIQAWDIVSSSGATILCPVTADPTDEDPTGYRTAVQICTEHNTGENT